MLPESLCSSDKSRVLRKWKQSAAGTVILGMQVAGVFVCHVALASMHLSKRSSLAAVRMHAYVEALCCARLNT
eukprot:359030-Chlamydomonas_euryale.AAC.4